MHLKKIMSMTMSNIEADMAYLSLFSSLLHDYNFICFMSQDLPSAVPLVMIYLQQFNKSYGLLSAVS